SLADMHCNHLARAVSIEPHDRAAAVSEGVLVERPQLRTSSAPEYCHSIGAIDRDLDGRLSLAAVPISNESGQVGGCRLPIRYRSVNGYVAVYVRLHRHRFSCCVKLERQLPCSRRYRPAPAWLGSACCRTATRHCL